MLDSSIGRLRIISIVEGISFLVLVLVAMPMKYIWGMPNAVTVVGMVHGILFLLFCVALVNAVLVARWRLKPPLLIFLAGIGTPLMESFAACKNNGSLTHHEKIKSKNL